MIHKPMAIRSAGRPDTLYGEFQLVQAFPAVAITVCGANRKLFSQEVSTVDNNTDKMNRHWNRRHEYAGTRIDAGERRNQLEKHSNNQYSMRGVREFMGCHVQNTLNPGERVLYETRLHWIIYVWGSIFAALAFVTAGLTLLIAIPMLVYARVNASTSEFCVTDGRVPIKTGWISRRTIELNRPFAKVLLLTM
jgi:hypothetical protein